MFGQKNTNHFNFNQNEEESEGSENLFVEQLINEINDYKEECARQRLLLKKSQSDAKDDTILIPYEDSEALVSLFEKIMETFDTLQNDVAEKILGQKFKERINDLTEKNQDLERIMEKMDS